MKHLVFILFFVSTLNINAQNYDLIVTNQGDSIACHIDSITNTDIHFEMKINDIWVHTYTPKNECINYEYNTINADTIVFKYGSSFIYKILTYNYNTPTYDLIVTTSGDSIACHIDSITDFDIYFELKQSGVWVHTYQSLSKIAEYKYNQFDGQVVIFKEGSSFIKEIKNPTKYYDKNIYVNRYLFAPSAFPMQERLFSYSNITMGLHDFQYGFSDHFSLGFGTSMFFFPCYIMSVYSIPINENSAYAIGDLLMFSPYSDELSFFGNLLYGIYTKGNAEKNYSLGLGLWTTPSTDVSGETISPALNFSSTLKSSGNSYFITENYIFQYNINQTAESINTETYVEETFLQKKYIIGGISGFRIISKRSPRNSWQFAMAYVFVISEDIPGKYKSSNWNVWGEYDNIKFIPWPIISYSIKL